MATVRWCLFTLIVIILSCSHSSWGTGVLPAKRTLLQKVVDSFSSRSSSDTSPSLNDQEPSALEMAVNAGKWDKVRRMRLKDVHVIDAIRVAASLGKKEALKDLLKRGTYTIEELHQVWISLPAETKLQDIESIFQEATQKHIRSYIEHGKVEILERLVKQGAIQNENVALKALEMNKIYIFSEFEKRLNYSNNTKLLYSLIRTSALNRQFAVLMELLEFNENLDRLTFKTVIDAAARAGDLALIKYQFEKQPKHNLTHDDFLSIVDSSMKSNHGLQVTKYLVQHHLERNYWEKSLVLALKRENEATAEIILKLIKISGEMKMNNLMKSALIEKRSVDDKLQLNVLKYFYDYTEMATPDENDKIFYVLSRYGDRYSFAWFMTNKKFSVLCDFVRAYEEAHNRIKDKELTLSNIHDRSLIIFHLTDMVSKLQRQFNHKFKKHIQMELLDTSVQFTLLDVDQENPLKDFHRFLVEAPKAFPQLLPTQQLGRRQTNVKYRNSVAFDRNGVSKDFISRSLRVLLSTDPNVLAQSNYRMKFPLVQFNSKSLFLNQIFIEKNRMDNQELLHNYEFLGLAMGYALNKKLSSASLDFQESTLQAILGLEMNLATMIHDYDYLYLKWKSIVDGTMTEYDEEVIFDRNVIEREKLRRVPIGLNEQDELLIEPSENDILLKYDIHSQSEFNALNLNESTIQLNTNPEMDKLLKQLSPHNRKVFLKEASALYESLYEPQLEQIRKGLFAVIPRKELLQRYNIKSFMAALSGEHGKLTDLDWQKRTKLEHGPRVTPEAAIQMKIWFWEHMNQLDTEKQNNWLQIITGQSRFQPGGTSVMTLRILPREIEKNGKIWCRMSSHTCSNTLDISVVDTQDELNTALERSYIEAKDQMYAS